MQLRHRRAHLAAWCGLALLLPAILVAAAALRLGTPEQVPIRIAAPGATTGPAR
jgi:hypothetical protein